MSTQASKDNKPRRLYFKTYLQLIHNSVGTEMFRNFYIENYQGDEIDALSDGNNSCAFYVSSVLKLFEKLSSVHGTVKSMIEDLEKSGWEPVKESTKRAGDVVIWEAVQYEDDKHRHIGFYVGDNKAISTSWKNKMVIEHNVNFDGTRNIEQIFRFTDWD